LFLALFFRIFCSSSPPFSPTTLVCLVTGTSQDASSPLCLFFLFRADTFPSPKVRHPLPTSFCLYLEVTDFLPGIPLPKRWPIPFPPKLLWSPSHFFLGNFATPLFSPKSSVLKRARLRGFFSCFSSSPFASVPPSPFRNDYTLPFLHFSSTSSLHNHFPRSAELLRSPPFPPTA